MASEPNVLRLAAAVSDLNAWLKDQSIPGAIIGGLAANLWGRPRVTKDVDAVVMLGDLDIESFLGTGARFGFAPRISDAAAFAAKNRVLLLIHNPSKTDVDVSLGALPFEREMVDRASVVTVGGISFRLVSPEDLIIMKALARRPRDVADIEGVLDANPQLDRERVRYWVNEFAKILEAPEIVEDLERILNWKPRTSLKK